MSLSKMSKALPLHADVWLSISRECELLTAMRLTRTCWLLQKRLSGRWLDCHDFQYWRERMCKMAAKANRLDLVQACIKRGATDLGSAMECAIRAIRCDPQAVELLNVWWKKSLDLADHERDRGYHRRRFHIIQAMVTAGECASPYYMTLFKSLQNEHRMRGCFSLESEGMWKVWEGVGKSGNLSLMCQLHEQWCNPNRYYFKNFAAGASLADFQQLHGILNACDRCKPRNNDYGIAVRICLASNNLGLFDYLWDQFKHHELNGRYNEFQRFAVPQFFYDNMIQWAAKLGRGDILDQICHDWCEMQEKTISEIPIGFCEELTRGAYCGNHPHMVLEFERKWGYVAPVNWMVSGALQGGHLDILCSLMELNNLTGYYDEHIADHLVGNGLLNMMIDTCYNGHLHIAQHLLREAYSNTDMCTIYTNEKKYLIKQALDKQHFGLVTWLALHWSMTAADCHETIYSTLQQAEFMRHWSNST